MEALSEHLPVDVHSNVPVAEDGFVRDVDAGRPHAPGCEHAGPVPDEVARPVPQADVDAPSDRGLELGGEHNHPELDRVPRLVDGLVCLDKY